MKNLTLKLIVLMFFLFIGVKTQAQSYFYVDIDAPAGGDGSSWVTAFNNLQDGIDHAATSFTTNGTGIVRVSDGIYLSPTTSFRLKNGVQIQGGYNARNAPDWLINSTRFFGGVITTIEQGVNSQAAFEVHENLGDQTVLNGLTIRGLNGISIINPQAYYLGRRFSAKIINCSFDILNSSNRTAGIISNPSNKVLMRFAPTIIGSSFVSSSSSSKSIEVIMGSPDDLDVNISQTTFTNSTMRYYVFSILNQISNIVIDKCKFTNSAIQSRDTHLKVNNSTFSGLINSTQNYWGQFFLNGESELVATNCTFSNAEMFWKMKEQTYQNCIFYDIDYSTNVTDMAGIYNFNNCLFNPASINGSLVNPQTTVSGINNLTSDPLFLSTVPNSVDYLKLRNTSPARNAGNNVFIAPSMSKDLGGYNRILDRTVDIGAYEFCSSIGNCHSTTSTGLGQVARLETTDSNLKDLTVYPNPVKDVVKIKTTTTITSMELLNVQGQEVKKWDAKSELYVGDLPTGTYLLKVNTTEGTKNVRVVKE